MKRNANEFKEGIKAGLAIALGYIPVSFSFGMTAVMGGLPPWAAVVISMTNLTSAGQFAGMNLIVAGGSVYEIAAATFVINLRYMLMSLSLSQKLKKMPLIKRALISFGITDEIFAVASTKSQKPGFWYMLGLITLPYIGWAFGTIMGAYVNKLLPDCVSSALGIMLYAMFIAIIIPASRKSRAVLCAVTLSALLSCILYYLPISLSQGWSVIIVSVSVSALCAVLFEHKE